MELDADLVERLEAAVEAVRLHTGCGDNSCMFVRPGGMATNGGCRCLGRGTGDGKPGAAHALARLFRTASILADRARASGNNRPVSQERYDEICRLIDREGVVEEKARVAGSGRRRG